MEEFLEATDNPAYGGSFRYGRPNKGHGWTPITNAELLREMAAHLTDNAPAGTDTRASIPGAALTAPVSRLARNSRPPSDCYSAALRFSVSSAGQPTSRTLRAPDPRVSVLPCAGCFVAPPQSPG